MSLKGLADQQEGRKEGGAPLSSSRRILRSVMKLQRVCEHMTSICNYSFQKNNTSEGRKIIMFPSMIPAKMFALLKDLKALIKLGKRS